MSHLSSIPDFVEITTFIQERVATLRQPARQWADLARLSLQGQPHDAQRLSELEARINAIRAELRGVVLVASEHFTEEQLHILRKQAGISKFAWRAFQSKRPVTTKHGFSLIIY
ncbi:hypothetical protein [Tengunoibacter tsumagoiensis]|uniref:Uncharacterized protein n=1 Tax=Tengunoibacter tsumagoiensis TaxID=2014871 RepID=A0A401ZTN6_9CHLR|nr:hypothetical protein [Tengunoibacter tsumagoiensis]GCE10172.1 hypothetical protein KTT_00310 [Tengunoibacter tsumagoiensis]